MVTKNLLANIHSGVVSIETISTNDFQSLMLDPKTKSYGLMVCSRAYFMKAAEVIGGNMDEINLNDEHNRQILSDTYDLVQMDQSGQFYINKAECIRDFTDYFLNSLNEMINPETKQVNFLQMFLNIFRIRKDIKEIGLNLKAIEKIDSIKRKYLEQDSRNNLPRKLLDGWHECQKELMNEETIEMLDYCKSTEEFFEMIVGNAGCVDSLFVDLKKDIDDLKKLLGREK